MTSKLRLDELLVKRKFLSSRTRAAELIKSGKVKVNDVLITKPGKKIEESVEILVEPFIDYVSRGYLKLKKAIEVFGVSPVDKVVCDIGSSTGGFTQLLLELKAKKIFAIDVGSNQMNSSLKENPAVVSLENTDIRSLDREFFDEPVQLITSDLSFISTGKVVSKFEEILFNNGQYISLIKPQFEAGPDFVKHGIVRSREVHKKTLRRVIFEFESKGLSVEKIDYSPIKGKTGNIEYLFHGRKLKNINERRHEVELIVDKAFCELA